MHVRWLTQEERRRALEDDKCFSSPDGVALAVPSKNRVTEVERVLSDISRRVTNFMVNAKNLGVEHFKFLDNLCQEINSNLLNFDIEQLSSVCSVPAGGSN